VVPGEPSRRLVEVVIRRTAAIHRPPPKLYLAQA
jgi:hypothetical protein